MKVGFLTKETPREISKEITEGKREPQHIGKKSNAVLQQEFFSMINESQAIMSKEEQEKFNKKYQSLVREIKNMPDGDLLLDSLKQKYSYLGRIPPDGSPSTN